MNVHIDRRTVHKPVNWVKSHNHCRHSKAKSLIEEAKKQLGEEEVERLIRQQEAANCLTSLAKANGKWPNVVSLVIAQGIRQTATDVGANRSSVWYIKKVMDRYKELTGYGDGMLIRQLRSN